MCKLTLYFIFLIFCFNNINAELIIDEFKNEKGQCNNVCTDSFFLLPVDAGNVCERGCRFFTIIYLTDGHDINTTKQQCYLSCKEAYNFAKDGVACITGCNAMSKKREIELTNILAFIEQDTTKNLLLETEIEILESDILSDPVIKNQIELGYNLEYRIPETRIRTMPIAEIIERRILESKMQSGDWLDCASRNSGIPKSILLTAILIATIVVLILLISSGTDGALETFTYDLHKTGKDIYSIELEDDNNEKTVDLASFEERYGDDDLAALIGNEIEFSKLPNYQSEPDKVGV